MPKFAMLALTSLMPLAAWAQETVVLRDGTQFSGRMTSVAGDTIVFRDANGGNHRFDAREIDSIRFNSAGANYGDNSYRPDNRPDGQDTGGGYVRRDTGNYPPPPPPPPPGGDARYDRAPGYNNGNPNYNGGDPNYNQSRGTGYMTLPAGTQIAVRTNENVNSRDSGQSRSYSAQVDQDVVDPNGNLMVPRGSDAQLIVRRMNDNSLALDLQSISVNGQRYSVNSRDVVQAGNARQGVGENKRTAEYVGGTAVLGTLLGAIAGGGKGAAIGALAGGAAGAGAEVLTRGGQVNVPAESVLTFRLDTPITLNPIR